MNYGQNYGQPFAARAAVTDLAFVRRVYTLLLAGIAFAIAGAMAALYVGAPVMVRAGGDVLAVPPIVAFELQHGIVMLVLFFGAFFAASFSRRVPALAPIGLFGFTFVNGIVIAPSLFIATLMASQGNTLDPSPVRDAFLLTGAAFTGLTSYAFITKKDFSFLGAALTTGLWVLIGASLLALFLGSAALNLAIASVGVLLFSGYILYDTSRILRSGDRSDAVGAALSLFLDVVNLFLSLLRILSAARRN